MRNAQGFVTAAQGFRASGMCCGIKDEAPDLALLVCDFPAAAAGTFTTNRFCAAPVALSRDRLRSGRARAIVVNSGCANAGTGPEGRGDAEAVTREAARLLGVEEAEVLAASTGRIGRRLPVGKVLKALPALTAAACREGGRDAALAILTTDTCPKEAIARAVVGGREIVVGGMAKGAGMIFPGMATMLCFLTTDAAVSPACLQSLLGAAVMRSFNRISVDGDRSTNDSVFALASGKGGNPLIERPDSAEALPLAEALGAVCASLAEMIVRDGEGASKLIEIVVRGGRDPAAAAAVAYAIANSPLFKTAMYGEDPNWGRILSAMGASGAEFDPGRVELLLQGERVFRGGAPCGADEARLRELMKREEIRVEVILGDGAAAERVLTCDLTPQYVDLNAV